MANWVDIEKPRHGWVPRPGMSLTPTGILRIGPEVVEKLGWGDEKWVKVQSHSEDPLFLAVRALAPGEEEHIKLERPNNTLHPETGPPKSRLLRLGPHLRQFVPTAKAPKKGSHHRFTGMSWNVDFKEVKNYDVSEDGKLLMMKLHDLFDGFEV